MPDCSQTSSTVETSWQTSPILGQRGPGAIQGPEYTEINQRDKTPSSMGLQFCWGRQDKYIMCQEVALVTKTQVGEARDEMVQEFCFGCSGQRSPLQEVINE